VIGSAKVKPFFTPATFYQKKFQQMLNRIQQESKAKRPDV
jgi:hypothetical protein